MKDRRYSHSKNTKFVRIDNSTWIEASILIPDDVARIQFLQKIQLAKAGQQPEQAKNDAIMMRS